LAEELHFGRTAEQLRLTTAHVSQSIKKQERITGAPLFDRTTRAVQLIPLGERLHRELSSRPLATVEEQTAAPRLVTDVAAGSPGEAFCQRHGFRHTRSRHHDLLTYCDVHHAWLSELVDAEHPGYRLTHWTGDLPNAPRVEELLRSPSRPGNAVLTAADADGDLAAYAVAVVGALFQPRARQYGPAVLPDHRGRRLGRWVNAV
jgi:Bacterial regulatory helix-turn-helix protein, lysR family